MALSLLFACCILLPSVLGRVVDTEYGPVQGTVVALQDGGAVVSFHGIPFAKPPVGDLRLAPPEAPEPWEEVLVADRLPDACPQGAAGIIWLTHPLWIRYDEDCLYLNIVMPDESSEPAPVMVFMHGGGYQAGAGFQYPGHFLASRGVVVVTLNYRLGALGFMSTGDDVAPGNYGLLDQIRALEFVRDNIAAFGGDPGRVTIFGESAGASSCGLLGLLPPARGLVHQIITQSGSDQAIWAINSPEEVPADYTREVAAQLDCPTDDSQAMVDCLRQLPYSDIRSTSFTCKPGAFCLGFSPVVDGTVLPDTPVRMRENGDFAEVPLMSGINTEEASLGVLALFPSSLLRGFNRTEFLTLMYNTTDSFIGAVYPDRVDDIFEAFNYAYTPQPYKHDEDLNRDAFVDLGTDGAFGYSLDMQVESQATVSPVYQYVFGFFTAAGDGVLPEWIGVPHAGELPYVFGLPLLQLNPEARADSGITDLLPWTEEDIVWADFVMDLWANFAKFGNPTPEAVEPPSGNGPVTWDLTITENANYFYFHRDGTETLDAYRSREHSFWRDYLPYIFGMRPPAIPDESQARYEGMESDLIMGKINDMIVKLFKAPL